MKKIFTAVFAVAICLSVFAAGCSRFTGNYVTKLTAEQFGEKVAGLSFENVSVGREEGAVSGYSMKYEYNLRTEETASVSEKNGNGEFRFAAAENGSLAFSGKKTSVVKEQEDLAEDLEYRLYYADGVRYVSETGERGGERVENKTKQSVAESEVDFHEFNPYLFDFTAISDAIEGGMATAYLDKEDANKIKIVYDAAQFAEYYELTDVEKFTGEIVILFNEAGALAGFKSDFELQGSYAAGNKTVFEAHTELLEYDGLAELPPDGEDYSDITPAPQPETI